LRRERKNLNWSQDQLATEIGTSALSINRWEHDKTIPRPYYRKQLCRVFNVSAEALFNLQDDEEGEKLELPSIWSVPHLRNLYFTDREHVLAYLHDTLTARKTTSMTQTCAINGLGGIGKTQTAVEYAYRYGAEYNAVLWAKADSHQSLVSDFVALAEPLNLPEKENADQTCVVRAILLNRRGSFSKRDYPNSVATTWSLSFERVEEADPIAANLLRLCAFLHSEAIPEEMIIAGAAELGPVLQPIAEDALRLGDALGEMRKYSLAASLPPSPC